MKTRNICFILLITVYCLLSTVYLFAEDWALSGQDLARSRSTNEKLSQLLSEAWRYSGTAEIVSSPSIADGVVVFGTRDRYVRALKESDGSPLWSLLTGDEICASPCVAEGKVYIPSTDGKIYCLQAKDGTFIWNYRTGGTELSSPVVSPPAGEAGNSILFMGSGFPNNKVLAINATTKQLIWEKVVDQIVYSSPALADNGIPGGTPRGKVFIGCDSGRYYTLDQNDGSEIWSYNKGGDVLLSSPLISGDSVYLLPGGTNTNFYRVDMDSAQWPAQNWSVPLEDPNAPVVAEIADSKGLLGVKLATSSPMKVGNLVAFVVRFDYLIDTIHDWALMPDLFELHEYVIAIDPGTKAVKWQKPFGSRITSDQNKVPPFGLCPTPASMQTASNELLVVCSGLFSEFRILDPANGNTLMNYDLDGACLASPAIANSRIFIATENGSLYAFQCNSNRAPSAPDSGFFPANNNNVISATPTISWNGAYDPDASDPTSTLRYLIRVDDDGEIMQDYDLITTTNPGETSITLSTPISNDTKLVYAIRTIDDDLAYSDWSVLQSFWVNRGVALPDPPTNLRAVPGDGYVELFWDPSPSQDVKGYLVAYKQSGGTYGAPVLVGDVNTYQVSSLTNGLDYTFQVKSEDYDGFQSIGIEITARPAYPIMLNSTPYDTLVNALAGAQSGDTVKIGIGTFVIPYTLPVKEGVHIQGYSPYHTILNGIGLDRVFQLTAGDGSKGTISNFTLYGAQVGIDTAGYKARIKNTIIRECNIGILVTAGSNVDIINNTLINNTHSGLQVSSSNTNIRNNIIMDNDYGIYCDTGVTPAISYNNIYGNTTANYFQCMVGTGDISLDVLFIDEPAKDYRVQIDQSTIDMGDFNDDYLNEPHQRGTRVNQGAYGNTPYAATSGSFSIATTTLSDGQTNAYYSVLISTVGGSGPITWTITSGSIPAGLAFNTSTGEIKGTVQLGVWGTYDFSTSVVDYLGNTDSGDFSIIINQSSGNTLSIVTNLLSDGQVRAIYKTALSAVNGFPPYTWSIIDGALPANMVLNSSTGEIIGTPPYGTHGQYTFAVQVTDADLYTVNKSFTMVINPGAASGSSGGGKGKTWCFIATAVYGSPLAPAVTTLRHFRDEYLLTHNSGQWLVAQYYRHSPPLAKYIARRPWARIMVGIILIPAIAYSWFMVSTGSIIKTLFCIVLIFCGLFYIRHRRRQSSLRGKTPATGGGRQGSLYLTA